MMKSEDMKVSLGFLLPLQSADCRAIKTVLRNDTARGISPASA